MSGQARKTVQISLDDPLLLGVPPATVKTMFAQSFAMQEAVAQSLFDSSPVYNSDRSLKDEKDIDPIEDHGDPFEMFGRAAAAALNVSGARILDWAQQQPANDIGHRVRAASAILVTVFTRNDHLSSSFNRDGTTALLNRCLSMWEEASGALRLGPIDIIRSGLIGATPGDSPIGLDLQKKTEAILKTVARPSDSSPPSVQ